MQQTRCINCMKEITPGTHICPHCGCDQRMEQMSNVLRPNTILQGRYLVGRVIGKGGFGITYVGFDLMLEVKVAIKEYYPCGIASRNNSRSNQVVWESQNQACGADMDQTCGASQNQKYGGGQGQTFGADQNQVCEADRNQNGGSYQEAQARRQMEWALKEARQTLKISDASSIVSVYDAFQENDTACIVMEFVEGTTLKEHLMRHGVLTWEECADLLLPVADGLALVHKKGIVHRNISPTNIMVCPDGTAKLLDLGAAMRFNGRGCAPVEKNHFNAVEQYIVGGNIGPWNIGPWTDVYAFAATLYCCLTGKLMTPAPERLLNHIRESEITFPNGENIPGQVKTALCRALAIDYDKRTRDMERFKKELIFSPEQNIREVACVYGPPPVLGDRNKEAFSPEQNIREVPCVYGPPPVLGDRNKEAFSPEQNIREVACVYGPPPVLDDRDKKAQEEEKNDRGILKYPVRAFKKLFGKQKK